MQATSVIHKSWNPIVGVLYIEPLKTLTEIILPNCSFTPKREQIFNVFKTPLNKVKVVIIGQDPYPNPKFATGYAFAVPPGIKKPPSLEVIEEEVLNDDPSNMNPSGEINLDAWTDQGIMLLNSALTVQAGVPGSHTQYWRPFTERVVNLISRKSPCIWLLWGKNAQSFIPNIEHSINVDRYDVSTIDQIPIDPSHNYVMTSAHPMAERYESGRFKGLNHFYKTNRILTQKRVPKITW